MPLNNAVNDNESRKFEATPADQVAVRVLEKGSRSISRLEWISYVGVTREINTPTREIYRFYSDAGLTALVATVTVDYTDATLEFISQAVRT